MAKRLFFFMTKEDLLELADIVERNNVYKYFPSENTVSNSVAFFTGGMYEGQYLVSCEISTASKEETAMGIFRVFSKAIKKLCKYRL